MDIDFMNKSNTSSTDQDDQMMEMMLMHMEKLPDFSDISDYPVEEFTNNHLLPNNNDLDHTQPLFNHPTMSFSSNHPPPQHEETYLQHIHGKPRNSSMAAMREMIFRIAAMQPVYIDPESVKPPKRRNVKISTDPQSVAARHRRERISERIRILQRMVPGGTKMDTASMLDEAIHYVKFLKDQVQSLERVAANNNRPVSGVGFPVPMASGSGGYFPVVGKGYNRQTTTMPTNLQHLTDS